MNNFFRIYANRTFKTIIFSAFGKHSNILYPPLQVNYLLDQFTSQLTLIIESTIFESADIQSVFR